MKISQQTERHSPVQPQRAIHRRVLRGGLVLEIFLSFLAGSICIIAILALMLRWGVSTSIRGWNERETELIQKHVQERLISLYKNQGFLDSGTVHTALNDTLHPSLFAYVEALDGSVLFLYRQGEVVKSAEEAGQGKNFLRRHGGSIHVEDLFVDGRLVARYAAGTFGFEGSDSNAQFLSSLNRSIIFGFVGSIGFALLIGFWISIAISRQSRAVAAGITAIREGKRTVGFPSNLVRELQIIADNAESLQAQLLREETLRRQWTSDIAHDLRTPVASLRCQIEGMLDGVLPLTPERVNGLYQEILRMQRLVQDLSDLNKFESPEFRPNRSSVSVSKFFNDLHSRFDVLAKERNCSLLCESRLEVIEADEMLLFRGVSNLVQNALQYGQPGPIELSITRDDVFFRIEVRNLGVISEEQIPFLFNRLYRGDPSRSDGGSGLGLAIVAAIAKAHEGRASYRTTEDGKSCFQLFLHKNSTQV
ncbi:MAG: HAMP domain-containing sensor histidine kinase [Termitinemataceae bacterium]